MEYITLALFCAVLLLFVILKLSILYALIIGMIIFFVYARLKGFHLKEILSMCLSGILTAKNVLITFFLIGILTAFWRASGTIAAIICYSSSLFLPSLFLLITFLLNSMISFLTGTSFGTSATMGVICATMGASLGISPALTGGAVLSGAFFGDRCSPVSTSALLVSELTKTSIFTNIRAMLRSGCLPFFLSCALFAGIGFFLPHQSTTMDLNALFQSEFQIHFLALIPALVVLALSFLRINVKLTMTASILSALPLCLLLQKTSMHFLLQYAIFGYTAKNDALSTMISGGGIVSMLKVSAIVCLSSAYSGIFKTTGLLTSLQKKIRHLSAQITPYGATLCTSMIAGMISCNQTLNIMLTHQLCETLAKDNEQCAIYLEDTAVIISPLIPWSIAGAVPLAIIGAPTSSLFFSFFLYLLPVCCLFRALGRAD